MSTQTAPAAAASQPAAIRLIPLNQLHASPRNVRKTTTAGGIAELVASIRAHGLLQNLNVSAAGDGFEVEAGNRRRLALQQLADQGEIPADHPVPCQVLEAAAAAESSLAENVLRENMHPADQCDAFRDLIDKGQSESDVAARFGVTVLFVRQRLKLAKVAPKVIEAFRAGKLSLASVEAFAISNDHGRQLRVLKQADDNPRWIRQMLTQGEIPASDKRVRFVTLAAYEAAGGAVRNDLFNPDAGGFVADEKLLDRLVAEKLEAAAVKVRAEGWAFVEVGADLSRYSYQQAGSAAPKAKAGALVLLDHHDGLEIVRGVLKPGQRLGSSSSSKGSSTPAKVKKPGELSFAQVQQLQAERNAVLALQVATNPRLGIAALAASMASSVLGFRGEGHDKLVRISRGGQNDDRVAVAVRSVLEAAPATKALAEHQARMRAKLPKSGSLFAWLLEQPEATSIEILALGAGAAFNAVDPVARSRDEGARFGALASVDMAPTWRPTPEWLAQLPRAFLVHAVTEALGKAAGEQVASCKGKAAAVAKAAELLNPSGAARAPWLPAPLRMAVPPAIAAAQAAARAKPKARPAAKAAARKAPKAVKKAAARKPAKVAKKAARK